MAEISSGSPVSVCILGAAAAWYTPHRSPRSAAPSARHADDAASATGADGYVAVRHADDERADIVQRPLSRAGRIGQAGMRVEAAHSVRRNNPGSGHRQARPEQTALAKLWRLRGCHRRSTAATWMVPCGLTPEGGESARRVVHMRARSSPCVPIARHRNRAATLAVPNLRRAARTLKPPLGAIAV